MSVRMSHPDVADEITVAESAVPFHATAGWSVIDEPKTERAAGSEPAGKKTDSGRPAASAATKNKER